ncbi:MAG: EVE domain-containing protein [Planctomycetota bacterium]
MQYWLIKSEPDTFSIQDLARAPRKTTGWEGVRNYQARNFLRAMKKGDLAIFYHSNAEPPAAVGVARVVREAYPDDTAWNPKSPYHDPKASPANPLWSRVDVQLLEIFARAIPLDELRQVKALAGMELLRRGSRLSVTPVTAAEFRTIEKLARAKPPAAAAPAAKPRPGNRRGG